MKKFVKRLLFVLVLAILAFSVYTCSTHSREKPVKVEKNVVPPPPEEVMFKYLGSTHLPTGYLFKNTEVGGLSGIDYNTKDQTFYAISDDRASVNFPRFYTLNIHLDDGVLSEGDIELLAVTEILNTDNTPYEENQLDPEAIRYHPGKALFYWSSEGDRKQNLPPSIRKMNVQGEFIGEYPLPQSFQLQRGQGIRDNQSLESLALSSNGKRIYTAVENALYQDGPETSAKRGSLCRVAEIDLDTEEVTGEFIYTASPVAKKPYIPKLFATNGLVELLAITNKTFIALERSFTLGKGNTIRLYATTLETATNIKEVVNFTNTYVKPMPKKLLLDLDTLNIPLDNIEGITFGPTLPSGDATLILIADNNFNTGQSTLFVALAVDKAALQKLTWSTP